MNETQLLDYLKENNLNEFQSYVYKYENEILTKNHQDDINYKNTLLHKLIKIHVINIEIKINAIYILCDIGFNINAQNFDSQTCLHLILIDYINNSCNQDIEKDKQCQKNQANELIKLVKCFLQNGCDLTLIDRFGLCSYNYIRRIKGVNPALYDNLIKLLKIYYPTYWLAIDNLDINLIRRLVNSWCKYINVKKRYSNNYITICDYARKKNFQSAVDLFDKLEIQMSLCFAVFALNIKKIENILNKYCSKGITSPTNDVYINFNFKNMIESNSTLKYYICRTNNFELVNTILSSSKKFQIELCKLNDYMLDERRLYDIPILFKLLKELNYKFNLSILKNIVKPLSLNDFIRVVDISQLHYRGQSIIFYSIDIDLSLNILEYLLGYKNCFFELFTRRNCNNLNVFQYVKANFSEQYDDNDGNDDIKYNMRDYLDLFNRILIDYIVKSKHLRLQLAYNGFNFKKFFKLNQNFCTNEFLNANIELKYFLLNVNLYQNFICKFHQAVFTNNYENVCKYYDFSLIDRYDRSEFADDDNDGDDDVDIEVNLNVDKCEFNDKFELKNLFINNLIDSKVSTHNQTVVHRAVFNQNTSILDFLLEKRNSSLKYDSIRDHCYRTPLHYAYGMRDNKSIIDILLDYGFSENVFDKDGQSPLDFQERNEADEIDELIYIHKNQLFHLNEPNPWTFSVWTRLQQVKENDKQVTLFDSKVMMNQYSHSHDHHSSHCHSHEHSHQHLNQHHHANCHHHHDYEENDEQNGSCHIV